MNTTASYSSEHSWSRRCSTETIFSIQGKETDVVCDTSDTEWCASAAELEPVTDDDDDAPLAASTDSDNEIISTRVIAVSVNSDGSPQLADGEATSSDSDSELDLYDYWKCAQCRNQNNNPLYRYCERCFKVRKNFFPPRPKRKQRRKEAPAGCSVPRSLSQDSGLGSAAASQDLAPPDPASQDPASQDLAPPGPAPGLMLNKPLKRRRAESLGPLQSDSDSAHSPKRTRQSKSAEVEITPLVKTISDPALTIDANVKMTPVKLDPKDDLCIVCCAEPKSGVFVHGRIAHICCCYKCAVKVWTTAKRCPVCNCKVSNVLKAVVM